MPDDSGASAVNTGVHTSLLERTPSCGCIGHPAFPAPSISKANEFAKLGHTSRRENAQACPFSPAVAACRLIVAARCYRGFTSDSREEAVGPRQGRSVARAVIALS